MIDNPIAVQKLRPSLFEKSRRRAGDIAKHARDWSVAADNYQSHLELHPDDFTAWIQLGHARKEEGNFSAALEAYRRALFLKPTEAELLLDIGNLCKSTGDFAAALDAFGQSMRLQPSLAESAAMIQVERLSARLAWHHDRSSSSGSVAIDYATLISLAQKGELAGRGAFSDYFRSFEAR